MSNPNPSPATRFKKGISPNPGGRARITQMLRKVPTIRSLEEVKADARAWRGSPRQLFESVARDPDQPLDLRLAAAGTLLKYDEADLPTLTPEQRRRRIGELLGRLGPVTIEGKEVSDLSRRGAARGDNQCVSIAYDGPSQHAREIGSSEVPFDAD